MDYDHIKANFDAGVRIAEGAATMTDTEMSYRILGTAWPRHFNKVVAEAMYEHIEDVGLPTWSEADQTLARAVQMEVDSDPDGLETELDDLSPGAGVRTTSATSRGRRRR
jgi:aminobenzoyl-glutamate utilization protein B